MDVLTTSPGASSTYPHHHHHHHHHQQSHHHSLIRADGGTAEVKKTPIANTNGWHAGKGSDSIETSAQQQDSRMSPKSGKGKAKETDDVRSPRRLAASKALQQVVRNSAPPASSTKGTSTSEQGETSSSATNEADSNLASNADAVVAAVSSSSPTIRQSSSSSSTLLPNGFVRERSARASSPSSPLARGRRVAASQSPLLPGTSDPVRTEIDDAEMNQFHFQAYPQSKTAILPRAPPTLPYDASYLPLSPMGTDQIGHTLQAPNLPANGTSGKAAETAKTGAKAGGQGKKVLPGQELESHIVSELPGQKAMPWGLQTTLMEKQHAGPRARTKSGMVKRTAVREGRRSVVKARGNDVHDGVLPLKVEDDLLSENDSPRLPLIQVSSAAPDTAVLDDENAEGGKASLLENGAKSEKETTPSQQGGDIEMTEVTASTRQSQAVTPPPRASPAKGRARISEYTSPAASSSAMTTSAGEESPHAVDSTAGNTRRPREAHKRLKIVGGYYRKPGMHREDVMQQSESSNGSLAGPSRAKNGGAARSSSRGTSFAPDEENADTTVNARSSSEDALSGKREGSRAASIGEEAAGSLATSATPSVQPALAGSAAAIGSSLRRMTTAPPSQGSPSKLMHASGEASAADDNAEGNNEFCETCRGVGHFICCDGCPRSFHFACINPPLDVDELPKSVGDASDTWYCNVCRAERRPKTKAGKRNSSVLDPLLRYIDGENPSIFALPHDVRNYFKGVATANDGSYVDSSMLRPIKVNKYGIIDEREPLRLKDKNGKPIFCYRCGESAMPHEEQEEEQKSSQASTNPSSSPQKGGRSRPQRQAAKIATAAVMSNSISSISVKADESKGWRKMISCDFCALHWHLDCLDPPLASMPSLSRKWMCPNHIEHVMPSERIPKSVANSTTVHELPVPSKETIGPGKHYRMRVVNDGQIDIIPDPLDTYTGPAHDGPEDGLPPPSASSATLSTKYGSGDKGWEEMNLPAYKAYPTVFGSSNNVKLKYRIPEKVIRLDFWSKLDLHREQLAEAALRKKQDMDRQGLDMLALIANAASASTFGPGGEISGDDNMRKVETRAEKEKKRKLNIGEAKELIAALHHQPEHPYVAAGEEPVSTLRQSFIPGEYEREFDGEDDETKSDPPVGMKDSTSSHGEGSSSSAHNDDDDDDNLEDYQLQAIRKIIAHKGKEALLRFLLE